MSVLLQNGDVFGEYEILECLSAGGQANIFHAKSADGGSEVCLKVFRDRSPGDEASSRLDAHYRNLWRALGRDFANYAYVPFQLNEIDGELVALLKWSDGKSLRDVLASNPNWNTRFRIAERLTYVVRWMHKLEPEKSKNSAIVHLDLKPENILVEFSAEGGEIKPFIRLIDFDNARVDGSGAIEEVLASIHYSPPEQIDANRYDELEIPDRCDVFALAVILFELLCGRRPFSDNQSDQEARTYSVDLSGLDALNISESLLQGILLALHPRPEARYGAGKLHSLFYQNHDFAGIASNGSGMKPWISPANFVLRIAQGATFERVYRYRDGPTRVGFRQLTGAPNMPDSRDSAIDLLPSPAGWYIRPSNGEVQLLLDGKMMKPKGGAP